MFTKRDLLKIITLPKILFVATLLCIVSMASGMDTTTINAPILDPKPIATVTATPTNGFYSKTKTQLIEDLVTIEKELYALSENMKNITPQEASIAALAIKKLTKERETVLFILKKFHHYNAKFFLTWHTFLNHTFTKKILPFLLIGAFIVLAVIVVITLIILTALVTYDEKTGHIFNFKNIDIRNISKCFSALKNYDFPTVFSKKFGLQDKKV